MKQHIIQMSFILPGLVYIWCSHMQMIHSCHIAFISMTCVQAHVPATEGELQRDGQKGQIHPADGHRDGGWLQVQVPELPLDGGWEGRPRGAQTHVRPPGQSSHW